MPTLVFDTGALVALENRSRSMLLVVAAAEKRSAEIHVPMSVVVEWWEGVPGQRTSVLDGLVLCHLSPSMARAAGKARALANKGIKRAKHVSVVDASVMAYAAALGAHVYTTDMDDMLRLRDSAFPPVRLLLVPP